MRVIFFKLVPTLLVINLLSCSVEEDFKKKFERDTQIKLPKMKSVEYISEAASGDFGEEATFYFKNQKDFDYVVNQVVNSNLFVDTLVQYDYSTSSYFIEKGINKVWIKAPYGFRFEEYFRLEMRNKIYRLDSVDLKISYMYFEE